MCVFKIDKTYLCTCVTTMYIYIYIYTHHTYIREISYKKINTLTEILIQNLFAIMHMMS